MEIMLVSDSATTARWIDHLLYTATAALVIWQWTILDYDEFTDCFSKVDELEIDAIWIYTLISLQLLVAITFTIWRVCLMSFSEIHQKLKKERPVRIQSPRL